MAGLPGRRHGPSTVLLVYGALGNRLLDKLHGDPRWPPFLRRVGIAPDQIAVIGFRVNLPHKESSASQ